MSWPAPPIVPEKLPWPMVSTVAALAPVRTDPAPCRLVTVAEKSLKSSVAPALTTVVARSLPTRLLNVLAPACNVPPATTVEKETFVMKEVAEE